MIGAALAALFAVGWWAGRGGAAGSDLYQNLDVLVEIIHKIERSYVDPVEPKTLVEGAIRGIPAFAISMGRGPREGLEGAARFARALAHAILGAGLPPKTLLSVNVPNTGPLAGYRFTKLGQRSYRDQVEVRTDLRGDKYFWIGGPELEIEDAPDTDGATARFLITRAQASAFVERARSLLKAGRPICPMCSQPKDPGGHICPRSNGHAVRRE